MGLSTALSRLTLLCAASGVLARVPVYPRYFDTYHNGTEILQSPTPLPEDVQATETNSVSSSTSTPTSTPTIGLFDILKLPCSGDGPLWNPDWRMENAVLRREETNYISSHNQSADSTALAYNLPGEDEDCGDNMVCRITQKILHDPLPFKLPETSLQPQDVLEATPGDKPCCRMTPGCWLLSRKVNRSPWNPEPSTDPHDLENYKCCIYRFTLECEAHKPPMCVHNPWSCSDYENWCPPAPFSA